MLKITILALAVSAAFAAYLTFDRSQPRVDLSGIGNRSGAPTTDTEFLNLQKAAEYYKLQIRRNPDATNHYVELAQLYLQQARITGRHHAYVGMAYEMLDGVLKRDPNHFEALLTRTAILLTQHRFAEALNLAEERTRLKPSSATAWGLLSDARKELGDYAGAVQACDKMLSIRPDLRSYARAAHLREIHGDLRGALGELCN